jgi:hypothetical protein
VKTILIELDLNDDLASIRERMAWGYGQTILLILPAKAKVFNRKLDLVLIQRYSQSIGSPLGLVTKDPGVRMNARLLNITLYRTRQEAFRSRLPITSSIPFFWQKNHLLRKTRVRSFPAQPKNAYHCH